MMKFDRYNLVVENFVFDIFNPKKMKLNQAHKK